MCVGRLWFGGYFMKLCNGLGVVVNVREVGGGFGGGLRAEFWMACFGVVFSWRDICLVMLGVLLLCGGSVGFRRLACFLCWGVGVCFLESFG